MYLKQIGFNVRWNLCSQPILWLFTVWSSTIFIWVSSDSRLYASVLHLIIISWLYSPLKAKVCQPISSLISTSPQTEQKDQSSSFGVPCSQHVKSPAYADFLDQNYRPVATQIHQNAELVPVCPAGDCTWNRCFRGSEPTSVRTIIYDNRNIFTGETSFKYVHSFHLFM